MLQPKDSTEERLLALAVAMSRVIGVQQYVLDRLQPTDDEAHKKHVEWADLRRELSKASDSLQVHFLGD
jgi:hypothetical protein